MKLSCPQPAPRPHMILEMDVADLVSKLPKEKSESGDTSPTDSVKSRFKSLYDQDKAFTFTRPPFQYEPRSRWYVPWNRSPGVASFVSQATGNAVPAMLAWATSERVGDHPATKKALIVASMASAGVSYLAKVYSQDCSNMYRSKVAVDFDKAMLTLLGNFQKDNEPSKEKTLAYDILRAKVGERAALVHELTDSIADIDVNLYHFLFSAVLGFLSAGAASAASTQKSWYFSLPMCAFALGYITLNIAELESRSKQRADTDLFLGDVKKFYQAVDPNIATMDREEAGIAEIRDAHRDNDYVFQWPKALTWKQPRTWLERVVLPVAPLAAASTTFLVDQRSPFFGNGQFSDNDVAIYLASIGTCAVAAFSLFDYRVSLEAFSGFGKKIYEVRNSAEAINEQTRVDFLKAVAERNELAQYLFDEAEKQLQSEGQTPQEELAGPSRTAVE